MGWNAYNFADVLTPYMNLIEIDSDSNIYYSTAAMIYYWNWIDQSVLIMVLEYMIWVCITFNNNCGVNLTIL